jgi:hypothetical protein
MKPLAAASGKNHGPSSHYVFSRLVFQQAHGFTLTLDARFLHTVSLVISLCYSE